MSIKTILKIAGSMAGLAYAADLRNACKEIYDIKLNEHMFNNTDPDTPSQPPASLRRDAVTALTSLGYKVRDSKEKVEDAITHGNCTTVQDIIRYALTNGSK